MTTFLVIVTNIYASGVQNIQMFSYWRYKRYTQHQESRKAFNTSGLVVHVNNDMHSITFQKDMKKYITRTIT